jgi:hypothetical protein
MSLLPLLFTFLVVACFVKLAARLLRRTRVSWKHSILFGLLLGALALAKSAFGLLFADFLPPIMALAAGLSVSLGIGTWFFSTRAASAEGDLLGWRGSSRLTGLALGLMLAVSFALLLVNKP